MAKTLEELAAEKGFIEAEETAEPTQEVIENMTEEEKKLGEILDKNLKAAFAKQYGKDAANLKLDHLPPDDEMFKTLAAMFLLMLAQTDSPPENKKDEVIETATDIAINNYDTLNDASDIIKYLSKNFSGSDDFKTVFEAINNYLEDEKRFIDFASLTSRKLWLFLPFMFIEYSESLKEQNISLRDFFKQKFDENGNPTDNEAEQLLKRAKERQAAALPHSTVKGRGVSRIPYPLDKINSKIWGLFEEADGNGQLTFAVEKQGSNTPLNIIYSINFDALESESGVTITKKLTAFDKRLYIAAGALYNAGFEHVTISQLYESMGNKGRPNATDIKKINNSLTKMRAARITLDNTSEHSVYKNKPLFLYDASLLPMERVSAIVNGKVSNSVIHLFREPPLITFAKDHAQITTMKREILETPISKTEENLNIEDYLTIYINHLKNKNNKLSNKLLYTTIYKNTGINTKMQRSRAKEKITKCLEYYKKIGFIKGFSSEADGITVYTDQNNCVH